MAKEDVVAKAVTDLQAAVADATKQYLGTFYDAVKADGGNEQPASPTPAPEDKSAELEAAQAQVADLKNQLVAMTLKDKNAEEKLQNLLDGLDNLEGMFKKVAEPAETAAPDQAEAPPAAQNNP